MEMLVEFQSVTEAVRCAVELQQQMARRNGDMPASRCLLYRIGINLGDIIVEESDIFGDGVNVAARLETMAAAGGICIPAAVRDQVGDRIGVGYEDLGDQQFKNINRPIRVFKILANGLASSGAADKSTPPTPARKPSIAVLPFANMSGESEQEFFADGLTEDIITELSHFRELLVISRNAVFTHKGKAVKAQQAANLAWIMWWKAACAKSPTASEWRFSSLTARQRRTSGLSATIESSTIFSQFGTRSRLPLSRPCSVALKQPGMIGCSAKRTANMAIRMRADWEGSCSLGEPRSQCRGAADAQPRHSA
jgi:hypothetical protein